MNAVADDRLIDVAEAAEFLSLHRSWLERATRKGEVPHYKFGRCIRYDRSELLDWLKSKRCGS